MMPVPDIILAVGCDQKRLASLGRDAMQPDRVIITASSILTVETVLDYSPVRLIVFVYTASQRESLDLFSSLLRTRRAMRIPWLVLTEGSLPVPELERCSAVRRCEILPSPRFSRCLNEALGRSLREPDRPVRSEKRLCPSSLPETPRLHEPSPFPNA